MKVDDRHDVIVAGSGMGGMTAAALLANRGHKVLVLEAAHALGGCSSSYYRQGYWFESGATTLIGFDENQPLRYLEEQTGMSIPRVELQPSMQIRQNGSVITRFKNGKKWINEASRVFGNSEGQQKFWELAYSVARIIWKVSLRNNFFPPTTIRDIWELIKNNDFRDIWVVRYALDSVEDIMQKHHIDTPTFKRFVDEQLMITAQSTAEDTPFLFGAPALTYTNYSNFYVPGGFINMIHTIGDFIEEKEGNVKTKSPVQRIIRKNEEYLVQTTSNTYNAPVVISNIPVWNLPDITSGEVCNYFENEAKNYEQAWGAVTMGIVTEDTYPNDLPLHHQLHLGDKFPLKHVASGSVFVSLSHAEDHKRAEEGTRVLNVSVHTKPDQWFKDQKEVYEEQRDEIASGIISHLQETLPGFHRRNIIKQFSATPLTWENWIYRKKGRVGGIPQSMSRSLLDWMPAETPFNGLFLCGDTVFPGQGIPGVTLSGINAFHRVKRYL